MQGCRRHTVTMTCCHRPVTVVTLSLSILSIVVCVGYAQTMTFTLSHEFVELLLTHYDETVVSDMDTNVLALALLRCGSKALQRVIVNHYSEPSRALSVCGPAMCDVQWGLVSVLLACRQLDMGRRLNLLVLHTHGLRLSMAAPSVNIAQWAAAVSGRLAITFTARTPVQPDKESRDSMADDRYFAVMRPIGTNTNEWDVNWERWAVRPLQDILQSLNFMRDTDIANDFEEWLRAHTTTRGYELCVSVGFVKCRLNQINVDGDESIRNALRLRVIGRGEAYVPVRHLALQLFRLGTLDYELRQPDMSGLDFVMRVYGCAVRSMAMAACRQWQLFQTTITHVSFFSPSLNVEHNGDRRRFTCAYHGRAVYPQWMGIALDAGLFSAELLYTLLFQRRGRLTLPHNEHVLVYRRDVGLTETVYYMHIVASIFSLEHGSILHSGFVDALCGALRMCAEQRRVRVVVSSLQFLISRDLGGINWDAGNMAQMGHIATAVATTEGSYTLRSAYRLMGALGVLEGVDAIPGVSCGCMVFAAASMVNAHMRCSEKPGCSCASACPYVFYRHVHSVPALCMGDRRVVCPRLCIPDVVFWGLAYGAPEDVRAFVPPSVRSLVVTRFTYHYCRDGYCPDGAGSDGLRFDTMTTTQLGTLAAAIGGDVAHLSIDLVPTILPLRRGDSCERWGRFLDGLRYLVERPELVSLQLVVLHVRGLNDIAAAMLLSTDNLIDAVRDELHTSYSLVAESAGGTQPFRIGCVFSQREIRLSMRFYN